jgi:hypothetical protein
MHGLVYRFLALHACMLPYLLFMFRAFDFSFLSHPKLRINENLTSVILHAGARFNGLNL